eukprot:TRINITY_DN658_c2_g2_i1.p1 TRINITY_DN658_c2_g2~~TRINITY_DN658_c2_g2_i1.p1  ORF type:complete len:468 (+),score=189.92 TRINITY_DN658_c2_g2_i1:105-1406(+)
MDDDDENSRSGTTRIRVQLTGVPCPFVWFRVPKDASCVGDLIDTMVHTLTPHNEDFGNAYLMMDGGFIPHFLPIDTIRDGDLLELHFTELDGASGSSDGKEDTKDLGVSDGVKTKKRKREKEDEEEGSGRKDEKKKKKKRKTVKDDERDGNESILGASNGSIITSIPITEFEVDMDARQEKEEECKNDDDGNGNDDGVREKGDGKKKRKRKRKKKKKKKNVACEEEKEEKEEKEEEDERKRGNVPDSHDEDGVRKEGAPRVLTEINDEYIASLDGPFPILSDVPRAGDWIEYRMYELSAQWAPILSQPKRALVLSFNHASKMVELEVLHPRGSVARLVNARGELTYRAAMGEFRSPVKDSVRDDEDAEYEEVVEEDEQEEEEEEDESGPSNYVSLHFPLLKDVHLIHRHKGTAPPAYLLLHQKKNEIMRKYAH